MSPPFAFTGIVLAAGRSTRMGRDKALLDVDGAPLWRRQREVLAAAGAAEILLSARSGEQPWVREARGAFDAVVADAFTRGGPMVGVTAGLERASHPWLAVLAVDLPNLGPEWFSTLLAETRPGVGVVGRRAGGFEPLAAVYPRGIMWSAWHALVRGEYALQPWIAQAVSAGLLRVREIGPAEEPMFANWNEPADCRKRKEREEPRGDAVRF